jgi:hypothetical protein
MSNEEDLVEWLASGASMFGSVPGCRDEWLAVIRGGSVAIVAGFEERGLLEVEKR